MKAWRITVVLAATLAATLAVIYIGRVWHPQERLPRIENAGPPPAPMAQRVVLRGRIDDAMLRKVSNALRDGAREFSIDSSYGGEVFIAQVMAAMLRSNRASLTATGICYSACALFLIGVDAKFYGPEADIQIHGARYTHPMPGQDDDGPARIAAEYMVANGVPREIAYGRGRGINLYRLTPDELARIGIPVRFEVR